MIDFQVYLITDGFDDDTAARLEAALPCFRRGAAAVQLRAKALGGRALYQAARALRELTRAHRAPLLVNDRADVALAAGADGVQLPSRGLGPEAARRAGRGRLLVGASVHGLEAAQAAARDGADFVVLAPIWAPTSKPQSAPPLGVARLAEVVQAVPVPVFALGGVDAARAAEVRNIGAGAACIGTWQTAEGARALAVAMGACP